MFKRLPYGDHVPSRTPILAALGTQTVEEAPSLAPVGDVFAEHWLGPTHDHAGSVQTS